MTRPVSVPHRRAFLASASALALSACSDLLGPPPAPQIYIVHPQFSALAGAKAGWSLAVVRPDTSAALNTTRIALTKPDETMDYYADAQYPDPLPDLVLSALVAGFEISGRLEGVSREEDALHADYDLIVEIKDFEAHYMQADAAPEILVELTAKLATSHGRAIVGSFSIRQNLPATANSIGAAAAALQQALGAAVTAIVAWALGFGPPSTHLP